MKRLLILFSLSVAFTACEDTETNAESFEYEEKSSFHMADEGAHLLELQSTNGSIHVTGSDTASRVYFDVTKRVKSHRSSLNARDYINDIQISSENGNNGLLVAVEHPSNKDLDYEIDFEIIAPIIFDYSVVLGNGNITINSITRNLKIALGNGNFLAQVILLNNCSVQIETGNGTVQLIIPGITNAELSATVGIGSISDTGLPFTNRESTNNSLNGTLGDGNGSIEIALGNGTIGLEGY